MATTRRIPEDESEPHREASPGAGRTRDNPTPAAPRPREVWFIFPGRFGSHHPLPHFRRFGTELVATTQPCNPHRSQKGQGKWTSQPTNHSRPSTPRPCCCSASGTGYEFFGNDARSAGAILGLTVATRQGAEQLPVAGFPFHQLDGYLRKLVAASQRVAVCEQLPPVPDADPPFALSREAKPEPRKPLDLRPAGEDPPVEAVPGRWVPRPVRPARLTNPATTPPPPTDCRRSTQRGRIGVAFACGSRFQFARSGQPASSHSSRTRTDQRTEPAMRTGFGAWPQPTSRRKVDFPRPNIAAAWAAVTASGGMPSTPTRVAC